ncbi:SDR family oxidoreductase [Shewanella glacialipiscicola]|uniref:UDP-glucose 4-epimerase family protein n=1 Tax=Shewanella glacialipiscicola TaxID=614069 RepID=UPI0021DB35A8|nr:SDR family oxidoreductase [Shewanella glacialipiscicola]MCU7995599.1 SDR family oxidoreductase [Shewanella glacialipiscicola]MCU8026846.1 SDR family oxidoreductase [Shewanella glacialipiscicola]
MKILLTGYSGFVGSHLLEEIKNKHSVTLYGRKGLHLDGVKHLYGQLNRNADFFTALFGCEVVIHAAARAHVMDENESKPLKVFREVNTEATLKLADQAAKAGVKRFIFISSIKVNGESTTGLKPFVSTDASLPQDPYAISKAEAEEQLLNIGSKTGMEVVIIRPPLIYGNGVKANFAALMNLVNKGIPLPFRCINKNKRSLVSVANLVDLIVTCIDHPKAANEIFLVSDDHDVSTASMVKHMSKALGKPCRLLPVPLWCYRLVGKVTGKMDVVDRLLGSLQVDITHTKNTLGWVPPQTLEEGFKETAEAFFLNNK